MHRHVLPRQNGVGRLLGVHRHPPAPGGIHHLVAALAGQHADPHAAAALAPHPDPIVTAVEKQAHFLGFLVVEAAPEVRLARRGLVLQGERDFGEPSIDPMHLGDLVPVGAMHFHLTGEVPVELPGGLGQVVAPLLERVGEAGRVERDIAGRELGGRRLDHAVGQARLERGGDAVPVLPLERHQQAPVEVAAVPGLAQHAGV
jgi:hypothetical protein